MPTTEDKKIASESGHWYFQDGTPCYEIKGKNCEMRPTTLRDARRLNLLPSVTEILKLLPKPALDTWKQKQVLMAALTLPRSGEESDEAYINRIMEDAGEQARKAREKGTAIHGAIEKWLLSEMEDDTYVDHVLKAMDALLIHLKRDYTILERIEPEKSFAYPEFGYGGKVDLHSHGLNFLCDFKTKDTVNEDTRGYDEQRYQLVMYRRGLGLPDDCRLLNVFISTSEPITAKVYEHKEKPEDWNVITSAINLWQAIKGYRP